MVTVQWRLRVRVYPTDSIILLRCHERNAQDGINADLSSTVGVKKLFVKFGLKISPSLNTIRGRNSNQMSNYSLIDWNSLQTRAIIFHTRGREAAVIFGSDNQLRMFSQHWDSMKDIRN